jgi:cytochrome P450
MAMYPEVQRRVQAEIDTVVGRDRLPLQSDRDSLPYVEAFCRELFRWHGIVPMGIAREVIADDWYKGMFIPSGKHVCPSIVHCQLCRQAPWSFGITGKVSYIYQDAPLRAFKGYRS